MTYKILQTEQNYETIITKVEYNFDGTIVQVDVQHFSPQSFKDIEIGIFNRAQTEKAKLDNIIFCTNVKKELDKQISTEADIKLLEKKFDEKEIKTKFSSYSIEDIKNQIEILDIEYEEIRQKLINNSYQYDLLIEELTSRI